MSETPTPRTDTVEYYFSNHDSSAGESIYRVSDDSEVTHNKEFDGFSVPSNFARQLEREIVDARKERDAWAYECGENMKLLKETIATATRAIEQRDRMAKALEFALNNALASGESENALRLALAAVKGGTP